MCSKKSITDKTEVLIACILACFYIGIAVWLQSTEWFSAEGLFFSEKAQLWTSGENSAIKINLFTYPLIGFLFSLPYNLINTLWAPFIASSLGMSFLAYCILVFLRNENASLLLKTLTLAIFIIHPSCIYIAVSGSTAYLTLLVALFYYISVFKYLASSTTFYLAISSFLLSIMILVDYKMIWLGLFVLPVFLITCFNTFPAMNGHTSKQKFNHLFSDKMLRQEYMLKLFSRLFLFYLLPVIFFISYLLLNDLYTNNPLYFIESLYANPLALEGLKGSNTLFASIDTINNSLWVVMGKLALGFIPLVIIAIYAVGKDLSRVIILCSTFLIIALQIIIYPYIPQSELFLLVIFVGIITIQYSKEHIRHPRYIRAAFVISMFFMFAMSWHNLYHSEILPERKLINALTYNGETATFESEKQIANFIINQVLEGEKVLTDDAVSYPIVALCKNASKFVLPYNTSYNKVIQNPADNVDYVLVSKSENLFNLTDKLSLQFSILLQSEAYKYLPVFKAGKWVIYKTKNR